MDRVVFTLEAANSLVPRLTEVVRRQLDRRGEIESLLRELSGALGEVPSEIAPDANDTSEVRRLKVHLLRCISDYQHGWGDVEALGAVVKDPRIGLCDFYGSIDGKAVWLCWKYGESEINYYHALDEGFSGRKAIRDTVRKLSLN